MKRVYLWNEDYLANLTKAFEWLKKYEINDEGLVELKEKLDKWIEKLPRLAHYEFIYKKNVRNKIASFRESLKKYLMYDDEEKTNQLVYQVANQFEEFLVEMRERCKFCESYEKIFKKIDNENLTLYTEKAKEQIISQTKWLLQIIDDYSIGRSFTNYIQLYKFMRRIHLFKNWLQQKGHSDEALTCELWGGHYCIEEFENYELLVEIRDDYEKVGSSEFHYGKNSEAFMRILYETNELAKMLKEFRNPEVEYLKLLETHYFMSNER